MQPVLQNSCTAKGKLPPPILLLLFYLLSYATIMNDLKAEHITEKIQKTKLKDDATNVVQNISIYTVSAFNTHLHVHIATL